MSQFAFLLLCRFVVLFRIRIVFTSIVFASAGENCAAFMQPIFTDSVFYPVTFFFCNTVVILTFFTAVTLFMFIRMTWVRTVNHFLEIILHMLIFFPLDDRQTSESLHVTLDGPKFDNFGGFKSSMTSLIGVCSW